MTSLTAAAFPLHQCRCTASYGQEAEEAGQRRPEKRDPDANEKTTVQDRHPAQVVKDEKLRQALVEKQSEALDEKAKGGLLAPLSVDDDDWYWDRHHLSYRAYETWPSRKIFVVEEGKKKDKGEQREKKKTDARLHSFQAKKENNVIE